jgi:hypothetical protein
MRDGGVGTPLGLAAVALCLGAASAAGCTIPRTRQIPCQPLPCDRTSEDGGLYPGEVFAEYGHGDDRATWCQVGGTIPPGQQCEVKCKEGYGDMDGTDFNHVACVGGELDWTKLPKCEACSPYSYQDKNSSDGCILCPGNLYTGVTGATSRHQCDKCKPGTTGQPGNCQLSRRTVGWGEGAGKCPDRCDPNTGQRCVWSWNNDNYSKKEPYDFSHFALAPTNCDVVNIVAVVSTVDDFGAGQWIDGLTIFQEHINSRGGLRLGENSVGYVNVTVVRVRPTWSSYETAKSYKALYENLCYEDGEQGKLGSGWQCADRRSAAAASFFC